MEFVINIEGSKFSINIFEKTDAFSFSILRMPHHVIFHLPYGTGVLRNVRETSIKTNFINHYSTLIFRMINQGGNDDTISKISNISIYINIDR